jgi:glyoxylase-like metal-dependent hydrolase (beta-lactamase superfamily II)
MTCNSLPHLLSHPAPHGAHPADAALVLHPPSIRLPVGHVYLWHDPGGLTLIDAGLPGSAPLIAQAIRQAGYRAADLRRLVLTHFHADHAGAAAEIASWAEVEVLAHHADAPFIRTQAAGPPPDLAGWERPVCDEVMSRLPPRPAVPCRVDRELPGLGHAAPVSAAEQVWPPVIEFIQRHDRD